MRAARQERNSLNFLAALETAAVLREFNSAKARLTLKTS
jgi:hypothetical protein